MESLDEHDIVELTQDVSLGLRKGMRGTVVMVYPEPGQDYEAEFNHPDGTPLALETINGEALTRLEP